MRSEQQFENVSHSAAAFSNVWYDVMGFFHWLPVFISGNIPGDAYIIPGSSKLFSRKYWNYIHINSQKVQSPSPGSSERRNSARGNMSELILTY